MDAVNTTLTQLSLEETMAREHLVSMGFNFALACIFAGLLGDVLLCGIFTMMLWQYYSSQTDRTDPLWMRVLVGWVSFLSYLFTGFLISYGAFHFVETFGLYVHFFETERRALLVLSDGIMAVSVQSFFAYRSFRLLDRNYLALISILVAAVIALSGSIGVVVAFSASGSSNEGAPLVGTYVFLWEVPTIIADGIITFTILYGLYSRRTGWDHTNRLISRLIFMTFECQVPPLAIALTLLIQYVISPTSYLTIFLASLAPKVYAIGLLFSLNKRISLFPTSTVVMMDGTAKNGTLNSCRPDGTIQVDVQTEVYEMRTAQAPPVGVNRRENGLEKIDDTESEGKTHIYMGHTANSSNDSKVHLTPPTPTSVTSGRASPTLPVGGSQHSV